MFLVLNQTQVILTITMFVCLVTMHRFSHLTRKSNFYCCLIHLAIFEATFTLITFQLVGISVCRMVLSIAYPVVDQRPALQPNGRGIFVSSRYPNLVVGSHLLLVYTALLAVLGRYPGRADGWARDCVNQCHLLIFLLAFCLCYLTGKDDWCLYDQPKNATISDCARQKKSRDHF